MLSDAALFVADFARLPVGAVSMLNMLTPELIIIALMLVATAMAITVLAFDESSCCFRVI